MRQVDSLEMLLTARNGPEQISRVGQNLWQRLTAPHPRVADTDRFLARSLSVMLVVMLGVGLIVQTVIYLGVDDPHLRRAVAAGFVYPVVLLFVPYLISRTARFRLAAVMAIIGFDAALVLSILSLSPAGLASAEMFAVYGIVPIAIAGLFFPLRVALGIVLLHALILLTTPVWLPGQTFATMIVDGLAMHLFISALLLVGNHQRNLLERLRQSALHVVKSDLERLVDARTADLNRTGEELQALSNRLAQVEEEERRQLAIVLHDQLGSELAALNFSMHVMLDDLSAESRQAIGPLMEEAAHMVKQAAGSVRAVIADIRPPDLDEYGLPAAVVWYAERVQRRSGVTVQVLTNLHVSDSGMGKNGNGQIRPAGHTQSFLRLDPASEIALLRIVQEALHNVEKHARAHNVVIHLKKQHDSIVVTVADDGCGFDPLAVRRPRDGGGIGLIALRQRAVSVGGTLSIASRLGKGTTINVEVPL